MRLPSSTIRLHPELRQLRKLRTPRSVQDFLDTIPINHERDTETCSSPLVTLRRGTAHCLEGALVAALALWINGQRPLLMDLKTTRNDIDHIVTLFKVGRFWGGITKTNHAVLRYREPIFRDPRELAASYFHEYSLPDGRKTLRAYSVPFDLRKYSGDWVASEDPLWDLERAVDDSPHIKLVSRSQIASLRRADNIELRAGEITEWP